MVGATCSVCPNDGTLDVGVSGNCEDAKDDGKDYGLNECDSGGITGCVGGMIQSFYSCTGGSPISADICTIISPNISNIIVKENNDFEIYFSRPLTTIFDYYNESDFIIAIEDSTGTAITDFEWEILPEYWMEFKN